MASVTINTVGKDYCTDLHFKSKHLCSHLDSPALHLVNATICDNNISVCVNITGTPPPSTTIQTQEDVSMAAKNQTQFCSTFDKLSVIKAL